MICTVRFVQPPRVKAVQRESYLQRAPPQHAARSMPVPVVPIILGGYAIASGTLLCFPQLLHKRLGGRSFRHGSHRGGGCLASLSLHRQPLQLAPPARCPPAPLRPLRTSKYNLCVYS